ncbi:MAG: hypothetical protein HKN31_03135 [Pricia sp.]|nr:hypothetical protein [Pricia sp.]
MSKKNSKPEKSVSAQAEDTNKPNPEMHPEMAAAATEQDDFTSAGTPTLEPPEAGIFAQGDMTAQAWFNSKKITGIWIANDNKNAYVYVVGVGWLKLNDANADSILAMYMISASARQGGNPVNYRKESDNKVHEIYCW